MPLDIPPCIAGETAPTIDQLLSLKTVAKPRISPDGKRVAYELSETDWKENAYVTQLWLADAQTGRTFQLTRGKKSSDNAQWSPDGRWLAFITERDSGAVTPFAGMTETKAPEKEAEAKPDVRQIWLISPLGGEAWLLSKHGAKINSFRWAEDSKQIAFTAPIPESKTAKARKEKYSDFEIFEEDYDQNQLWLIDVATAETSGQPVDAIAATSDRKINVTDFAWAPDGSRIAFSGTANPLLAFWATADIYMVDLAHGNAVKKVTGFPGPATAPRFSPDGVHLAFNTSLNEPYYSYNNCHIVTVCVEEVLNHPAMKPADVTDLTAGFDEDAVLLEWAAEGVYFRGLQKMSSHLFCVDPVSKTVSRVTGPDTFFLAEVSLSHDCRTMAFTASDATHTPEVFWAPVPLPGAPLMSRKLTDSNAQLANFTLGNVEPVSWVSKDGATIEGVLRKPSNYDPTKKYPLLLLIHGGPTGTSRPVLSPNGRYYPIEQFLAKGSLVLEPNYRGSAGYGEKFRSLNVRNLGVGDMWDVMSGIDALIARGLVDETKLGAMGWSQGGYISAFLTTNTNRFKAISVGAGISDWMTYYVNTDVTPFTHHYLHATPWDDAEIFATTSPITNIRKATTPTLIQHGDRDERVPPPNAFELYRGLKDVGVPTKLMLYAGFGHAITKPKSNRAVLQHNLDWFSHYVFGEAMPSDSPLNGCGETKGADAEGMNRPEK